MRAPLSRIATRLAYGARQLPRIAWYVGHGYALQRLSKAARRRDGPQPRRPATTALPLPRRRRLYADLFRLLGADLGNVEAGFYPLPADHDGSLPTLLRRSQLFFQDLPDIHRRRAQNAHLEVRFGAQAGRRPDYYLQNFHFQSGGWMTEESAQRYDTQVEVLFKGTANAMRRQALPALHEIFAGRDQRTLRLVDIGCGTGRFLDFVKQAWPRLPALGIDMSEAYLRQARRHLRRWSWLRLAVGKAEALPLPDNSVEAVTSIFTFHELPPQIRRAVMAEAARVLKPGGRFVVVDSLQRGDEPDYDGLLELFPQNYHEPYYASYLAEDFAAIAKPRGLIHARDVNAFLSKVMVFDKPA